LNQDWTKCWPAHMPDSAGNSVRGAVSLPILRLGPNAKGSWHLGSRAKRKSCTWLSCDPSLRKEKKIG
jgi:hypothetical protein